MKKIKAPFSGTFKNFLPLKQYFIRNRWPLALGLFSLLVVDFLQLLIPLVIKKAIDLLTTEAVDTHTLFKHGGIILGIALVIVFFRYLWRLLIFGHSRKVEKELRNRLYEHLQTLSLSFYQRTKTGDIMARAINDINAVRMAAGMGLVALTDGAVLGIAAIGFMVSINVKLTLISLIPAPIVIITTRILAQRMSSGFEKVQNSFSGLTERVREAFAGIRVTKAYNRDSWEYQRVKEKGQVCISANLDMAKILAILFPLMAIVTNVGLAIVIWLGGSLTILGHISIGDFVAFTGYLNLLTWPMMAMGWVTSLIQRGSASMGRINRILEEVPEIADTPQYRAIHRIKGGIEISGLNFRYPGKKDFALKGIQLMIDPGETVAVVGGVGSGKTTLLHAIPRLLDAAPRTIFVDGHDVREIPLKTLRENIGLVMQEPFIFSDTIRSNILFGRSSISQKDLEAVLQAASILEEIKALENGLDTILGERGVTLSGGQRQRLTIARALILDPPILILDDALSMVDTRTEERILNRIMQIRRNKTNMIVSHRISTISWADRIVVLERGNLIEQGSHNELMELAGIYRRLYRKQRLTRELESGGL